MWPGRLELNFAPNCSIAVRNRLRNRLRKLLMAGSMMRLEPLLRLAASKYEYKLLASRKAALSSLPRQAIAPEPAIEML
jgi:hypothetical protein